MNFCRDYVVLGSYLAFGEREGGHSQPTSLVPSKRPPRRAVHPRRITLQNLITDTPLPCPTLWRTAGHDAGLHLSAEAASVSGAGWKQFIRYEPTTTMPPLPGGLVFH